MARRPTALLLSAVLATGVAACGGEQQVSEVPDDEASTIEPLDAPATDVDRPDEEGSEDGVPSDNDLGTADGED